MILPGASGHVPVLQMDVVWHGAVAYSSSSQRSQWNLLLGENIGLCWSEQVAVLRFISRVHGKIY